MPENLSIDANMRNVLGAVTNDSDEDIYRVRVNPITGAILVEADILSSNTQIGSTIIGGTAGSVLFLDIGSTLAEDNTYFFYDPTSHYLGLGTNTPTATLDINGTFKFSDGSEVNGYFLTTDGAGNATWSALPANGYSLVQDDGSSVTQRTTLNFVNFFIVSDVSSKTQINLDTTAIGNDTTLQNTLIASTNFTTNLANNANFISTLTSNATFISNVVTQVNLTGTLTVETDGVTITGNGTTGSPLVAAPVVSGQASIQFEDEGVNLGTSGTATEVDFVGAGITATRVSNKITVTVPVVSASALLKTMTANEDLTAGQTVGVSNFVTGDKVARAARSNQSITITPTQNNNFDQYNPNASCPIGGDKFAYLVADASDDLYVIAGDVDTDTFDTSLGTAQLVTNDLDTSNQLASICKLDTDKFMVLYKETASATIIKYRIGTVGVANAITLGAAATFTTAGSQVDSIASGYLSADKAVMFYGCATPTDSAVITFTTTGTATNVVGTPASVGTTLDNNIDRPVIKKVDTDTFVLYTASGYAQAGTCLGTTNSTLGAEADTGNADAGIASNIAILSPTLIVFSAENASNIAEYTAATLSGTALTMGALFTGSQFFTGVWADSATSFIAQCYSGSTGVKRYTVSGTTIALDKTVILGMQNYQNFIPMDNGYYILVAQITTTFAIHVQGMSNSFLGIAQASVSKGATVSVLYSGEDTNQTNLAEGSVYQPDGAGGVSILSSTSTAFIAGKTPVMKAINSTTLII